MKKLTIGSIKSELNKLDIKVLSSEYKRGRNLRIKCLCNREFSANLYDLRKKKKCFFCNNFSLINLIYLQLKQFFLEYKITATIDDDLILKFLRNETKTKRQLLKKHNPLEFKKLLILGRIPLNVLDQIKYLNSTGLSNYEIYKWIRKENKYRISRSKINNIISTIK